MSSLSLYELNGLVRETIELSMDKDYWVEAELSEVRERSGHCYMELVQKEEHTHTPIAKASAKCWRTTWMLLKPHFMRVTGEALRAGMKVLLRVSPQFHEQYGFSWIVGDIDPTYTMGDMARRRQEIIRQLKEEGVFELNKELHLPLFAQRIAVVSSKSAAGFGDFADQLLNNPQGLRFNIELFSAIMQGEQIEQSIISALNQINLRCDDFDCVVIIRGGGATSDLSGFDTLLLAENVANFPLPVITGIGHERDECVLDLVAHTRMKTPTAVAAFLIDRLSRVANRIDDLEYTIINNVRQRLQIEKSRLEHLTTVIPHLFSSIKSQQESKLNQMLQFITNGFRLKLKEENNRHIIISQRFNSASKQLMVNEKHRLQLYEKRLELLNPDKLLSRGYSITMKDGKAVTSADELSDGDIIETRLQKGVVKSVVNKGQQ